MRRSFFLILLCVACLPAQVTLVSPDPVKTSGDILPNQFAGWRAEKVEKFSLADLPAFAGADDAEVWREYGFLAAERKHYVRGAALDVPAEHRTVEALRLRDSSGAYGIFTYLRQPDWRSERGQQGPFHAAVGKDQALLLRNSYCLRILDGTVSRDELAVLASALPTFRDEPLPSVPQFLPEKGVIRNSLKYVVGPYVFARLVPQIPADLVGFPMGAEAELARYQLPGKAEMTLLLVLYPAPQMAATQFKQFAALPPGLQFRRRGALISIVLAAPSKSDADLLLDRVNYKMDVVWNEPVPKHRQPTLAELIINIFVLAGILLAFALFSGLAFGALRLLTKRFYSGQVFDRNVEIIRLNLSD